MNPDTFGPPASHLTLLAELKNQALRTKVRFLGCVVNYDLQAGALTLAYPGVSSTALVDISHVLESMTRDILDVGSWLNVTGYVESLPERAPLRIATGLGSPQNIQTYVQAVLIWPTSSMEMQPEVYSASVIRRKAASEAMAKARRDNTHGL